MENTKNYKSFSIALIIFLIVINSTKVVAQKNIGQLKSSIIRKSDKKPILDIKIQPESLQLGNSIEVAFRIRNETDSTIVIFDALPERGFDIIVKDSNGLVLPLTKEGQRRKHPTNIIRRESVFIQPNDELNFKTVYLDKLFDLKHTSNYMLEVRVSYIQETPKRNKSSGIKNNVLFSKTNFTVE